MSFINLFNASFLMFLGILVLVSVLLVVYIESKMREQNHKMSTMVGLISSLAEEMNGIKFTMQNNKNGGSNVSGYSKLISVSDDEESKESEESEANDDFDDSESDDEEENDDEVSSNDNSEDEEVHDNEVKILKINNMFNSLNDLDDSTVIDLNELNDLDDLDDSDDSDDLDNPKEYDENMQEDKIQIIEKMPEPENENFDKQEIKNEQLFEPSFNLDLKTININLAEETKTVEEHKNIEETDYKKMTINKLRTIVSEKGLSSDPSKLKKPEILKMLGIE